MRNESGLTLIELMIVIAVTAIIAGVAIPNMVSWRNNAKYSGAIENVRGDLNMAKMVAIREGGFVAVQFLPNGYQIFNDNGATAGVFDAGEDMLIDLQLPSGVSIDLAATDFAMNRFRFDDRGVPENLGRVVITRTNGEQRSIILNRLGRISIQ